jgi:uncharacterized protein (DUF302 family)
VTTDGGQPGAARLTTITSLLAPGDLAEALVLSIEEYGMTVFARFDHAEAACGVGLALRPTEVVVFGNPLAGTALMAAAPTAALDLPLRALIWQDSDGATCLTTEDPGELAARHGVPDALAPVIAAMRSALNHVTREAAGGRPESLSTPSADIDTRH